nr:hypothetical protein [Tanacetum cinerariifolium]
HRKILGDVEAAFGDDALGVAQFCIEARVALAVLGGVGRGFSGALVGGLFRGKGGVELEGANEAVAIQQLVAGGQFFDFAEVEFDVAVG